LVFVAIHKTLSSILQLGNIQFVQDKTSDQATLPENTGSDLYALYWVCRRRVYTVIAYGGWVRFMRLKFQDHWTTKFWMWNVPMCCGFRKGLTCFEFLLWS